MKGISFLFAVLAWSVGVLPGRADVRLPAIFSDHMVLQSGVSVPVWGWAEPGEVVTIEVAGRSRTTRTGADGKWRVQLDRLTAASRPQTFIARGANTLTVRDVLIGEVWLGSGQSNMGMQVRGKLHGSVDRADEEVAAANYPAIRMFFHHEPDAIDEQSVPPKEPLSDRLGEWRVCAPETVADFSALGYFFARDLHNEIGMPVGIINVSAGNSPIEAWTSRDAQQAEPALAPVLEDWRTRLAAFDPASEERKSRDAKERWLKQRAEATRKNEAAPKAPAPFENPAVMAPGGLFNARIAPLVPYAIRGVIWSQGERNALGPLTGLYGTQLKTMMDDWRARWGSEMYFAWVQLPGFQKPQRAPSEPAGWGVSVREGMRRALAVPRTGMAITIDLGGEKAGHPTNKADFAARLSLLVLHDVYGKPIEIWSGPLFHTAKHDGHAMVLTFDHAMGLKASSGELEGFAIAGEDGKFVWARARIDGETVIASSDAVPEPAAVRYGWAANPKGNLVNAAGLPASPFRTDQWKEVPPLPLAAAMPEPNDTAQAAAHLEPSRRVVYKTAGDRDLHLDLFEPAGWKAGDKRACLLSIHGGGWTRGAPRSMYRFAAHCAGLGMLGISVEYRHYQPGSEVTVLECAKDARSALRYVRAHASELGIDPQKIVANGASAGGHLAAATALFDEMNAENDDTTISCMPNALVLFSPVIDTSTEGYGHAKVVEHWEELSPAHRVRPSLPPTIVFHGTGDATTPFKGARKFHDAMLAAGNRCELVSVEGAPHTYMFKDAALYAGTLQRMDAFLASLGFISPDAKP